MATTACTVHGTDYPSLSGPSEFGLSITMTATPDSISQDGTSQSAIAVVARGPNGNPLPGVPVRLDMAVNGSVQDFGTLSSRNIVTGSDGRAVAVYTAPPAPPPGAGGSGNLVSIFATPTGSNFQTAITQSVDIRLVPVGVILPPAQTPTPDFSFSPSTVLANLPVNFDASRSCAGSPPCTSTAGIQIFQWNFGDGTSGSGQTTTHTFATTGSFNVTLTVTNDRGVSASKTLPVSVSAGTAPTADFVFSPASPVVFQQVQFNAASSSAAAGRTIVRYEWNWGDGETASGRTQDHDYATAGNFTVTLTVTDDIGQRGTASKTITVGSGNPTAVLVINKTGGNSVSADGSGSSAAAGATITTYTFVWNDGTPNTSGSAASAPHTFGAAGAYTVRLTVTDNLGRTGTITQSVTVP